MTLFERAVRELGKLAFLIWVAIVHAMAAVPLLFWMAYPRDTAVVKMMLEAAAGEEGSARFFLALAIVCGPTVALYLIMGGARDFWDRATGRTAGKAER